MNYKPLSRKCLVCGKPGARTMVLGGYVHKRCLDDTPPKRKKGK